MEKALNFILLAVFFSVAFGLALSREAGTDSKRLTRCSSINDCKLEGCPCVNGICRCGETSVGEETYSRIPAQQTDKASKCEGTKVEAEAHLP